MRSILLALVFLVWLFLGWLYYNSQKTCCESSSTDNIGAVDNRAIPDKTAESNIASESVAKSATKASGPILFNYNNGAAILGDGWESYKSNLLASLKDDQLLQITGNYTKDEPAPSGFQNMGEARADEARKALGLSADRVQLRGVLSDSGVDKYNPYEAVSFRNITVTKSVDESIENKTIIRFPYNSTNKLDNKDVESYLDKVAVRVKKSGEKIRLTGHTDSDGSDASNIKLGQRRATVIKQYLVSKGVPGSSITTLSKGESDPIASNDTNAGKAQNRRTELEIVK